MTYEEIKTQTAKACSELIEAAKLQKGDILVVGCSSSEVMGLRIGKGSDINAAEAVYEGVISVTEPKGIFLAAQCCEHLNRAVIVEKEALLPGTEIVNVVPQPKAGGSFATTVYHKAKCPVAVEAIKADAGMDIGDTLIGMQLKKVAVPVRLSIKSIGEAHLTCARTRPKFIGGQRAIYDEKLSGGDIPR
ncbi:MAG: TIGR01440 family protein [Clostridiales bacterium]|nr:TIGR01440 family protein [Bacillota bacterium]MEE0516442.1 TIGR01440 family protein [Anaerovoracaceae bacterium]PWL93859.1 MAG: TIGR01440 family protein [Clostridiales bacterium]